MSASRSCLATEDVEGRLQTGAEQSRISQRRGLANRFIIWKGISSFLRSHLFEDLIVKMWPRMAGTGVERYCSSASGT